MDRREGAHVHAGCAAEQLSPHALPGGYPNLLTADEPERVAHAHGPNAPRLIAAKKAYDPGNVFTATPLPGVAAALPGCHRRLSGGREPQHLQDQVDTVAELQPGEPRRGSLVHGRIPAAGTRPEDLLREAVEGEHCGQVCGLGEPPHLVIGERPAS